MGNRIGRASQRRAKVRRRLFVERLAERRVLAAITGAVFDDANHSLQQEVGESNAPSRLVYIDTNDNAELDNGESFVVAETDGTFEFPFVEDGTYLLRLFNGTQTQTQTVPIEATTEGNTVSVTDALQLELRDGVSFVLTTDSVIIGDLQSGASQSVQVGNQLTKMQTLPDGKLLIISNGESGPASWVVDPISESVTPINLSGAGQSTSWSDLEIDASGRGVLLEQSAGPMAVRAIDASDSGAGVQVTNTTTTVPSDTQVLTSDTGNRTVFGWSGSDGLQLSLWSNVTESFITTTPVDVSGTSGLLAFDDASGLLALRTASGGVGVYDVDADFAPLHTLNDVTGPVAIDGARDLLMTVSPLEAMLKVINLRDGAVIADVAIDLSNVGQVASIAPGSSAGAVAILGAAGVTEIALRKPGAHEVTVSGNQDPDPVLFGVALEGENTAPAYMAVPTLETDENSGLALPAPTALNNSVDDDGDNYVLVQRSQPANGTADVRIDGSVIYTPDADFSGTDSFQVLLHDGRDASAEVTIQITVNPSSDSDVIVNDVPEGILPGDVIGTIETIGDRGIEIDDPRFGEKDGEIIFIGDPGDIDFETEPEIPIRITITDPETDEVIEEIITLTIRNENEPIEDIIPHESSVHENTPGDLVDFLIVIDPDVDQTHTLTVDDDRFVIEGNNLSLAEGVSVDFEKEPTIVVNVTATEVPGGGTFTQAITIEVLDVREQPLSIGLTNETVMELVPGDEVGGVTLDGGTPSSDFNLTVDDPRFEIDGSTLKLLDDQFVERASQTEIELTITAVDSLGEFTTISDTFVIDVLENVTPFHNYENPYDVNHNGEVSTLDALLIINYLNSFGPGPVGQGDPGFCYDVNADGFVTALDALLVLNEISRITNTGIMVGEGEKDEQDDQGGEGEQIPIDKSATPRMSIAGDDDSQRQPGPDLFDRWTELPQAARGAAATNGPSAESVELPSDSSSEEFAESIEQTIGLLSDPTS